MDYFHIYVVFPTRGDPARKAIRRDVTSVGVTKISKIKIHFVGNGFGFRDENEVRGMNFYAFMKMLTGFWVAKSLAVPSQEFHGEGLGNIVYVWVVT